MRRPIIAAAAGAVAWLACVAAPPATTQPVDRLNLSYKPGVYFWRNHHEDALARIAASDGTFDFVLLGDSITRNWESEWQSRRWNRQPLGKAVAADRFAGYNWLNLGIGGDGTRQIIWRCLNGELDGYETRLVSLMVGTNDRFDSAEDVAAGIARIVEIVKERQPKATILLNAILPRMAYTNDTCDLWAKNDRTNEMIRRLCDGRQVVWLDWRDRLLDASGKIDTSLMYDEVHPAAPGYEIWADMLMPYIRKAARPALGADVGVRCVFDPLTGAIRSLSATDGRSALGATENRYRLMWKGGDVEALEREDVVVNRRASRDAVSFRCTNPKMPGIDIVKRYTVANGGIRRTLSFLSTNATSRYVSPYIDCSLAASFHTNLWHLGAGYIGPYKPFPKVSGPRPVNEYKQSSKGLVLVHPEKRRGSFSHYRVTIDGTVVLPWWHSTIGRYRELHDRLWYLPDGYRMCLGTFGLYPGKAVTVTDQFNLFDGDVFTFFDDVFARDPDVAAEFAAIPRAPKWTADLFTVGGGGDYDDFLRFLVEATDEGELLPRYWGGYSWGDYRDRQGMRGATGGFITTEELAGFLGSLRAFAPSRTHTSFYQIVISASWFAPVVKEHPEWFRTKDRAGNPDSLFPGVSDNWQTMFCYPECREWMVEMLTAYAKRLGNDTAYVDESQMTNTIDWERDRVTRDDDTVKFWRALKRRFAAEGIMFFANGSGNPYADLNYMESPHELAPGRWRDWAGVGWGIGLVNRMRGDARTSPLVWRKGLDYVNRILALGWVPHSYAGSFQRLPVMRAVYQGGNLLPMNAKYTPDWKNDAEVLVESHSVRRVDAPDVLISFISRAKGGVDIPVTVDLASLGFAPETRLNVWKLHPDEHRPGDKPKCVLTDAQLKRNWRGFGSLHNARITDPELVHSGPAKGVFRDVIRSIAENAMEQYLFTAGPAALFAEDDLPLAAPWTAQRQARVDGRRVQVRRVADLILADRELDFSEVTTNGVPVKTRKIRLAGGGVGTLVRLSCGDWRLGWRAARRDPSASVVADLPGTGGETESAVVPPRPMHNPERLEIRDVNRERDGVKILRSGVYASPIVTVIGIQTNLPLVCTAADPDKLRLVAGPSRREFQVRDLETFAGFELSGARQLRLRFTHNFHEAYNLSRGRLVTGENPGKPNEYFAGIVVDYRVKGRYARRVSMSTGLYHHEYANKGPKWGVAGSPDDALSLGEWLEGDPSRVFSLDIARFAPADWDGVAFVSLGTCRILSGHHIGLEILGFNDASAKDFIAPKKRLNTRLMPAPVHSKPLKIKPRSLTRLDASEWQAWPVAKGFVPLGSGVAKADTSVRIAHDYEYLYLGVEAEEPGRAPMDAEADPLQNEHIEVLVQRPDFLVYQVIGDAKGRHSLYLDRKAATGRPTGIVCRGETVPGRGWRVFFAIPIDSLKFDMQRTPVTIRAEFARDRRVPVERTTWSPLETGYYETGRYGTIDLDFNW